MADGAGPGYGTPNWDMLGRWMALPPEEDGPFWALNLMRYRPVAAYGDPGDAPTISGREADDAYAPLGPLAAIGAMVAFHGDVLRQPRGEPVWDRVGIVRYPSRAAFFAMQQRDDFKEKHVHKEAGMAATIVLACHPEPGGALDGAGPLVLTVTPADGPSDAAAGSGLSLSVEGVIVGDDRRWSRATFRRGTEVADDPPAGAFELVVDPAIDQLAESIRTAPSVPGGAST